MNEEMEEKEKENENQMMMEEQVGYGEENKGKKGGVRRRKGKEEEGIGIRRIGE